MRSFAPLVMLALFAAASAADTVIHDPDKGLGDKDVFAFTFVGDTLWAGTQNGLSRLNPDGESWETTRREGGPVRNCITCLAVDGENLWVGTARGLARFDTSKMEWTTPKFPAPRLSEVYVSALLVKNGALWIGMWREGLYGMSKTSRKDGRIPLPATKVGRPRSVYALAAKGENLLVGTEYGLLIRSPAGESWRDFTDANGLPSNMISALAVDGADVWIGTGVGLALMAEGKETFSTWTAYQRRGRMEASARGCYIAHGMISTIVPDGRHIWVGTYRKNHSRFDKKTETWGSGIRMGEPEVTVKGAFAIVPHGKKVWLATPTSYYGPGLVLVDAAPPAPEN